MNEACCKSDQVGYCAGYSEDVDVIRKREYPLLKDTTYLDHAGTTLYAKSLIESFSRDLTSNIFGNPHSMSLSSQLSTQRIDDARLRALRFFNADPEEFDLVFVANATAAIKLVADALRDADNGFWYGYHIDSHTSVVGVRELARLGSKFFRNDEEVESWISSLEDDGRVQLLAFPGQSNMNGRRLPLQWCERVRKSRAGGRAFTLLDAASLVSTSPLDLSDASAAPDFTALSFYKIFGFPDLGALIVRKDAGHVFDRRRYFGGGTMDMVLESWHARKVTSIHDKLEDGTLPFHSIIALECAFETHERLYGSMENVSSHTRFLAKKVHDSLSSLTHWNGVKVCQMYKASRSNYEDPSTQGGIVTFNLRNSRGEWIGKTEVEKLAAVKGIHMRSGSHCNPGGTASSLGWTADNLRRNYSSGLRCGNDHDVMDGRPTGVLRVSLGAMSSMKDIDTWIEFVQEFYVEKADMIEPVSVATQTSGFYVESLSVYPIKSCGAFKIPDGKRWEVNREGLAWDREWCLIHQGTGTALSQKKYPRMTLIHPVIDLDDCVLRVTTAPDEKGIEISLSREGTNLVSTSLCQNSKNKSSTVCGDRVVVQAYSSPTISSFFSEFLGVPCTLARFPPQSPTPSRLGRFSGDWKQRFKKFITSNSSPQRLSPFSENPILLSNESPILLISRSSVNSINEAIKANPKPSKAIEADVFRGNIVIAETKSNLGDLEQPYIEDTWTKLRIGPEELRFDVLGSCQRCQMVCINQLSGVRRDEPFSTLAKTRKVGGKVLFGRHAALSEGESEREGRGVMVGDVVLSM